MKVALPWAGLLRFAPHGAFVAGNGYGMGGARCSGFAYFVCTPSRHYDKKRILFALRHVAFLKRHGYAMRLLGGGAGVFAPSLGLSVLRVMQKKRGVRISPFFSAPTGRTPGGVGVDCLWVIAAQKGRR